MLAAAHGRVHAQLGWLPLPGRAGI